jgi:ribosomal protein L29
MKFADLQPLSKVELERKIQEIEREYYAALDAVRGGREKNVKKPRALRRDLAKLHTAWQKASA